MVRSGARTATSASPTRPTARARELVEAGRARAAPWSPPANRPRGGDAQGRVWTAPEGKALLYSAILRPLDERHLLLPLSVPLAVCAAAEALRPGSRVPGQVAQRRLARRPQARRHPDRGQAAGRLGGDRRRPEPLHCSGGVPRRPPSTGDFALRRACRESGGVPTEPPRCCSGGTPPESLQPPRKS